MTINKFGQSDQISKIINVRGFKRTKKRDYNILGKKLTNVGAPEEDKDAVNLTHLLKSLDEHKSVILKQVSDKIAANKIGFEDFIKSENEKILQKIHDQGIACQRETEELVTIAINKLRTEAKETLRNTRYELLEAVNVRVTELYQNSKQ